jgi:Bacterial extracellular solute-binding proteins, family 5 Middle
MYCSQFWYPAGPAMNTLTDQIFVDGVAEYAALNLPTPSIDFPDAPCSNAVCAALTLSPLYYVTAPISSGLQFGYLRCQPPGPCNSGNSWVRAINDASVGLPNYFTWLNAWNPSAPQPDTMRQGFSQTTRSVNPYIASTQWDQYLVRSVYDSLYKPNPADSSQFNWITISTFTKPPGFEGYPSGLTAPPGTVTSYRFTLRNDVYFQDGRPLTAYDVAFSYLSLSGSGAVFGGGAAPMTGVTILGDRQFDIGVSSVGPFTLPNLTGLPILPGRYWTNAGSTAWDTAMSRCLSIVGCPYAQYTLNGTIVNCTLGWSGCAPSSPTPPSLMIVNPANTAASFDPIAGHIFIGSGPFECRQVTNSASGTCSTSGNENPPVGGSYTLTRFGDGLAPASSVNAIYFRSSGNLALWFWSQQNNLNPSTIFLQVALCYGKPVDLTGPCAHWQQGIGANGGPSVVGITQVSIVNRFYGLNWVAPFDWQANLPTGIGLFAPVLYEGSATLSPASLVGCSPEYPAGGYDC